MSSIYSKTDSNPVGSYPPTGIDVLIVGTGLAGLTASIECIRKGHNVRMLERMGDINTAARSSSSGTGPSSAKNTTPSP
ncbi:hypothetical protein ONZ43_g5818 [Nemania bipapillata]|uniref:Uncharacterized protein n=1 Tax=Nemania bipapillata TaxID=110536 RepID=A0ACC2I6A5_9PEZI|nr:hypothetical protein ONZ43_g5818 [Nemania bipapillata]